MKTIEKTTFVSTDLTISKTQCSVHEHSEEILKKARKISEKLGIVTPQFYNGHTTMTNFLYAGAPVSKMIYMLVTYDVLYYFDDFFGEDTRTESAIDVASVFDIWKEGAVVDIPNNLKKKQLYNAIAYVSNAIKEDSTVAFFKRYTKAIQEHVFYSLQNEPYETVDEYINIRLYTGGMFPVIELIEYAYTVYIDTTLLEKTPLLHSIKKDCALIGALSNDLFSYAKEKHSKYNLVNAYLETKEAASFEEAVALSIGKVNTLYSKYQESVAMIHQELEWLPYHEKEIVSTYLKGIENIIAASYHWQVHTDRYKHKQNVFCDMRVS